MLWTHAGNDTVSAANAKIGADMRGINANTRWGDDILTGSSGHDTLVADSGADTVTGGRGNDQIWIGDGRNADGDVDRFIFNAGDGKDTIYGFGEEDIIVSNRSYVASENSAGTMLDFGNGDSVFLSGVFEF